MAIDLRRTFSPFHNQTEDSETWGRFFSAGRGELTWSDLHEKPVSVVVGEAGIGKTVEFKNEAERLNSGNKVSFFVELHQLMDRSSWELALGHSLQKFVQWQASSEYGYFFLDAVDEARLISHAAFKKALSIVQAALNGNLERVRIAVSSRLTDWSIEDVRATVHEVLVLPIAAASQASLPRIEHPMEGLADSIDSLPSSKETAPEAFVVSLDPLSQQEAEKLADALGVQDKARFWDAIDDGYYHYMATRPLDLQWMVSLWNQKHSLGTYLELIDGNVANRLVETNPSYQACGVSLSPDRLRVGAEELAAASVFSGRAYIATVLGAQPRFDEIAPLATLSDWSSSEIPRLLASAVFDEATFGRVKFHHRSVREYLAACWAHRQIENGLPLHRILTLFVSSPFGEMVLVPGHRWALCWLAALNVKVRDWVVRNFPEMLLFDGDPQAWDALSSEQAFHNYVRRLNEGLTTDWYNDESEYRRVGRCLPEGKIASLLAAPQQEPRIKNAIFPIVKHARLYSCSDIIFEIYQKPPTSFLRQRLYALNVLEAIATPEQRKAIKNDLLSGVLTSNELIASALCAADWKGFSVEELTKVLCAAGHENTYGSGPLAQAIKRDLLPAADKKAAQVLLECIVAIAPQPEHGKRFSRHFDSEQPERAWILDVLPDCLERLLRLLPTTLKDYPIVCLEAAERIETLRHTGFTDRDECTRLHQLIAEHTNLRWKIALAIAKSEEISHSISRLTWGNQSIVSFDTNDIDALIGKANDTNLQPEERNVWFTVAEEIAFRYLKGPFRKSVLNALQTGPEKDARIVHVANVRGQCISGVSQRRTWKRDERQRKRERLSKHHANRRKLHTDVQHIKDASYPGTLRWLVSYSYENAGRHSLTHVDFELITKAFGQEIAEALRTGLMSTWASVDAPNPTERSDSSIPWPVITALAGLNAFFDQGVDLASLDELEITRAAKLAVWETNAPPEWFDNLATHRSSAVCEALYPWLCSEALLETESKGSGGALGMILRCTKETRALLLRPLVEMVSANSIKREDMLLSVAEAIRDDGLMDTGEITNLCKIKLVESVDSDGLIKEFGWLRIWLEEDTTSGWEWFESHIRRHRKTLAGQLSEFAKKLGDCKWIKPNAGNSDIQILLHLHALIARHLPGAHSVADDEDSSYFGHPIARLHEHIPTVLVRIRGENAHQALVQLMVSETDHDRKRWLAARVYEHATLEITPTANFDARALRAIESPFLCQPKHAQQLYEQVLARLEEIRKGVEEGPFSDRSLFFKGMEEKQLQLWLAARLHDTPNRKFGVHREEVVDADNRTDIQLSYRHWNVCIEIKPVDAGRGYSAMSLTDTLQTQIVNQYLKGYNSSHGILVLFRLDEKRWDIPGPHGKKRQPFSSLVSYLQEQANSIKAETVGVAELVIFPIDCLSPQ